MRHTLKTGIIAACLPDLPAFQRRVPHVYTRMNFFMRPQEDHYICPPHLTTVLLPHPEHVCVCDCVKLHTQEEARGRNLILESLLQVHFPVKVSDSGIALEHFGF